MAGACQVPGRDLTGADWGRRHPRRPGRLQQTRTGCSTGVQPGRQHVLRVHTSALRNATLARSKRDLAAGTVMPISSASS